MKTRGKKDSKGGILLNVGMRAGKLPNWIAIDNRARPGVDVVHDLEKFPYPIESGSCLTIACAQVAEHIPGNKIIAFMDEMWRMLKPEGQLAISAPYAGSPNYWLDPTHVTGFTENSWKLFDPASQLYMMYAPKPWRIMHSAWKPDGNVEAVLRKQTFDYDDMSELAHHCVCNGAMQKPEELAWLLRMVVKEQPKTVMEIGTAIGGTFLGLCEASHPEATLISLDLPGGQFGGGYTIEYQETLKSYVRDKQSPYFLRLNSHTLSTLDKVKRILKGKELDFLLIDGDHTYEGVKRDWEMYSPLVRKGGMIAFHDIKDHPFYPTCKVGRLWEEIKKGRKTKEFVGDSEVPWGGIGVVLK